MNKKVRRALKFRLMMDRLDYSHLVLRQFLISALYQYYTETIYSY